MGDRFGIIAGSGEFPFLIAAEARKKGQECAIAAIQGEAAPGLGDKTLGCRWFPGGDIAGLIDYLRGLGISKVVIAGKFSPDLVFRNQPRDAFAEQILGRAGAKSPVRLIGSLIAFLEAQGFRVLDPTPFLSSLFCVPGTLTLTPPSRDVLEDVDYGLAAARVLADLDIGQTVVVKDRTIVSIEGIEGTDQAILRGGQLAGPGVIAVKVSRSSQDPRVDIPAVGLGTVESLAAVRARGLYFEAGKIPFFQREEAINLADSRGISIVAVEVPKVERKRRKRT